MTETKNEHNKLVDKLQEDSRIMKRCFMTGKQCIFSAYLTEKTSKKPQKDSDLDVFIIMPFKPNLETFYQWSLKPFLSQKYNLHDINIRKADEVTDMGYVVCEKICKKIQESNIVFADISLENMNVFYEIGLAYGLERPVILMQKEGIRKDPLVDPRIRVSLSYNHNYQNVIKPKIFKYRGMEGNLQDTHHQLENNIIAPFAQPRVNRKLKISVFDFSPSHAGQAIQEDGEKMDDIPLEFHDILTSACKFAIEEIRSEFPVGDKNQTREKVPASDRVPVNEKNLNSDNVWYQIKDNINWAEDFRHIETINVDGTQGYDRITQQIESSFCTIIDVTPNTPNSLLAYFWLGYCHSRGMNVIPVFKMKSKEDSGKIGDKLAFDIRSLWYADYYEEKPYEFKSRVREIFEYLIIRDLADRQKRDFWNRFSPENEIKVFTGAIHVNDLMREVVGDWDVRAVSEIFSYLPMIRETTAPKLVTPFYSPEEAFKRYKEKHPNLSDKEVKDAFIKEFNDDIEAQLQKSSAIVIASPDVNPVTEFLLNKIYRVTCDTGSCPPFMDCRDPKFEGYVAIKEREEKITPNKSQFQRLFYAEDVRKVQGKKGQNTTRMQLKRGFYLYKHGVPVDKKYLEPYYNQAENSDPFTLLGHLFIARYPPNDTGNFVILLNGISGPATFALAQVLTKRSEHDPVAAKMNQQSEKMLKSINSRFDNSNCIGVQGIIKVEIGRDIQASSDLNPNMKKKRQYITNVDTREVISWEWYDSEHPQSIFKPSGGEDKGG